MEQQQELPPVRFERHRETIGGIEVVEAAYADQCLNIILDFKKAKVGFNNTRHGYNMAVQIFGKDSPEALLWLEHLAESNRKVSSASNRMWKFLKNASTPPDSM